MRSRFPFPGCVHGSILLGVYKNTTYEFDGINTRKRGTILSFNADNFMWSDGVHSYAVNHATGASKITLTITALVSPFAHGELVTQATSNATGYYISSTATEVVLLLVSGTFDNSHDLTGSVTGSATGITAVATASNPCFLHRSADGIVNYLPVAAFLGTFQVCSFVDCGTVAGLGGQLLLWFEYAVTGAGDCGIWYNLPGTNDIWAKLFTCSTGAIKHFHGARYIDGVLYVLTGDGNDESSILKCADVADLINNPATWKTRWGLDITGATRTVYLTTGAGAPYCVTAGNQNARGLDLIADADNVYAYWIPDTYTNTSLMRLNLAAGTVEQFPGAVVGEGWTGTRLADGTILYITGSEYFTGSYGACDEFVRLYALLPDGKSMTPLMARRRQDYAAPAGIVKYDRIIEYPASDPSGRMPGRVWLSKKYRTLPTDTDTLLPGDTACGIVMAGNLSGQDRYTLPAQAIERPPLINWAENGRMLDPHYAEYSLLTLCTLAQELTIVNAATGMGASMKLTPSGSGAAYAAYRASALALQELRGGWITVQVEVYADTTQDVRLLLGDGTDTPYVGTGGVALAGWRTLFVPLFIKPDATLTQVLLYGRNSGSGTDPTYWGNLVIVQGTPVCPLPMIPSRTALANLRSFQQGGETITIGSGTLTLSTAQMSRAQLDLIGAPAAGRDILVTGTRGWQCMVYNNCGQTVTFKVTGQTGAEVTTGSRAILGCNGTDVFMFGS